MKQKTLSLIAGMVLVGLLAACGGAPVDTTALTAAVQSAAPAGRAEG